MIGGRIYDFASRSHHVHYDNPVADDGPGVEGREFCPYGDNTADDTE